MFKILTTIYYQFIIRMIVSFHLHKNNIDNLFYFYLFIYKVS